jgi:uncharacterized protein YcbX
MNNDSPRLSGIRLHPIKSLDAVPVRQCRIGIGGGLEFDRIWALFSADGRVVNGKRTPRIHGIRTTYSADFSAVTLHADGQETGLQSRTFAFPYDYAGASEWFSEYFKQPVIVRHIPSGAPDDTDRNGPMVISTASLQAVTGWFDDIDLDESRRRFRSPLEIDGIEAFWEDRLYNRLETDPVHFTIGDVKMSGINPCPRCPVPARHSQTGITRRGFQQRFSAMRRRSYPSWANAPQRIQHFYHLGINTRVAPSEYGKLLRVGDVLTIRGS